MRVLVQRVSAAHVEVVPDDDRAGDDRADATVVGRIGHGLVALLGVTHTDTAADAQALARKTVHLRILAGETSLVDDPGAGLLVVSQFTLYGDARRGRRPAWSAAAPGPVAEPLVAEFCAAATALGVAVHTGEFGARMRVHLINEGPMTLLLES